MKYYDSMGFESENGIWVRRVDAAALEAQVRQARVWIEEDAEALRACHMPYNDTDPIDVEVRAEVDAKLAWLRATAETPAEPLPDDWRVCPEKPVHSIASYHRGRWVDGVLKCWDCSAEYTPKTKGDV